MIEPLTTLEALVMSASIIVTLIILLSEVRL